MTLTAGAIKINYAGDGSQTSFDVPFIFWDDDDLDLILTDSSGSETAWVRGTNYTVTGGDGAAGSIAVITSPTDFTPASGETLSILSDLPLEQDTAIPVGGALPSPALEQELDQIVRLVQQLSEKIGRSLKITVADQDSGVVAELTTVSGKGGEFLRVKSTEDGFDTAVVSSSSADASNSTPQTILTTAGSAGSSGDFARDDHVHQLATAPRAAARVSLFNLGGI